MIRATTTVLNTAKRTRQRGIARDRLIGGLVLFFFAFAAIGCDYETHRILVDDYELVGTAISDWRDVTSTRRSITIGPSGSFAIRVPEQTQYLAQFEAEITRGTGATFTTRAVPNEFDPSDGIAFHYGTQGCAVRDEEGKTIELEYAADTDKTIIKILVEADQTEFTVDCDRLYQGFGDLEATEYIIITADPDSEVRLTSVNYYDVDEI